VNENYSVLVRRLDAFLVHDTSRRRGEIPNTTLRAMHVVRERENASLEHATPAFPSPIGTEAQKRKHDDNQED